MTDEIRWGLLQTKTHELKVSRAVKMFRAAGIEPVLIKGLAAAAYYPEAHPRLFVDMDIAVGSDQFETAQRIARSADAEGLAIDLHCELRHLDTLPWADLLANSREMAVGDTSVRVLRPEDHLRVLAVHWLTDGGSNRSRLSDIYYVVANSGNRFDWSRALDQVDARRRQWLVCTLGIAERYLGLDLSGTPVENASKDLPQWLIKTVEAEWNAETPVMPLEVSIFDRKMLFRQVLRRLRPNPIWATVQMNGSFEAPTRLHYQIGSFVKRIVPSYIRVRDTLLPKGNG